MSAFSILTFFECPSSEADQTNFSLSFSISTRVERVSDPIQKAEDDGEGGEHRVGALTPRGENPREFFQGGKERKSTDLVIFV